MAVAATLLKDALSLDASSRAELVDELLASLDQSDKVVDSLWAEEVEGRIDAYDRGDIKSLSAHEVMVKYESE